MDLTSYVEGLGREFASLADASGDEARALVERLAAALESAIRLTLLDTLSAAADEITRDLAPGSVELRLRGRDPDFVVTPPSPEPAADRVAGPGPDQAYGADGGSGAEEGATARINFRLPEALKSAIEEAAGREGRSVNAWLVRVASAALRQPGHEHSRGVRGSQRYTGWVR